MLVEKPARTLIRKIAGGKTGNRHRLLDHLFADGARRNSSRWDLYSRLGDTGFLRADDMITLLGELVRQLSVLNKSDDPPCGRAPMTSFRQIDANRRNACKSTGPITEEGKQRSR